MNEPCDLKAQVELSGNVNVAFKSSVCDRQNVTTTYSQRKAVFSGEGTYLEGPDKEHHISGLKRLPFSRIVNGTITPSYSNWANSRFRKA